MMMIDDDDLFRPGVVPSSIIVHHHGVHGAVLFCIGGTCVPVRVLILIPVVPHHFYYCPFLL